MVKSKFETLPYISHETWTFTTKATSQHSFLVPWLAPYLCLCHNTRKLDRNYAIQTTTMNGKML